MPCLTMRGRRLASVALVVLPALLYAADPVQFLDARIDLDRRQITVASSSNREDFLAAAEALSEAANWKLQLDTKPLGVRNASVNARARTVTIEYDPRLLPFEEAADIDTGALSVLYVPLTVKLAIPAGKSAPAPPALQNPLARCFSYKLTGEKKKADIDITAGWQVGENVKPLYFWSVKAGCPSPLGAGAKYGKLGPTFSAEASQQQNADPDSMKAAIAYRKDLPIGNRRDGWQFNADLLSYEFERKIAKEPVLSDAGRPVLRKYIDKNSNLTWTSNAKYVNPWKRMNWTLGLAGFESGRAVSRTVKSTSSDREEQGVARLLFDLDLQKPLFRQGRPVLELHGYHSLRLPFRQEPFQRVGENGGEMYLTNKPRHWTLIEASWLITKGAKIGFQYKRGSLPPSFEFVDHQLTVGLNLLLKRR
ncbi:MAG: hypothetical protein HY858_06045 [Candidatus Solibacter usitatus]|nr:hypothetical protein [Candidatus Solibacter usitatus]